MDNVVRWPHSSSVTTTMDGIDATAWQAWVRHLQSMGTAPTERHARTLRALSGAEQRAWVNHSVRHGWRNLYAPRRETATLRTARLERERDALEANALRRLGSLAGVEALRALDAALARLEPARRTADTMEQFRMRAAAAIRETDPAAAAADPSITGLVRELWGEPAVRRLAMRARTIDTDRAKR